jgi:predicted small metal-binding protein
MLQVGCKDIGVLGCDFVARGDKMRKVECRLLEHVREAHPQLVAGLTDSQHDELVARISSQLRVSEAREVRHGTWRRRVLRM